MPSVLLTLRMLLFPACALWLLLSCSLFDNSERREMLNTHKRQSKIFYDRGDLERAEQQCRKGLELDSSDTTLRLTLAFTLLSKGGEKDLDEADRIFRSEIGMFTKDWRLLLGHGMVQQTLHRHRPDDVELVADARRNLTRALEINDESIEAAFNLSLLDLEVLEGNQNAGSAQEFEAHSGRAIELIESSDRLYPNKVKAARDLLTQQQIESERNTNLLRARRLLEVRAARAFKADRSKDALEAMERLSRLCSLRAVDYFNRGRLREANQNYQGAVDDFEQFVLLSRNDLDDKVTYAVQSLTRLRARLAELRTEDVVPQ